MANIIQAAKWMEEGKKVRRACWPSFDWALSVPNEKLCISGMGIFHESLPMVYVVKLESILAEDWEIYEPEVSES